MHILPQLKKTVSDSLRTLVTVAAVLVVAIPAAAWAGHHFTDVDDSNIFHGDIDWMDDNGVTKGCNPPANTEYCPDDFVTREQMAAFMHRLQSEGVFAPAGHEHAAQTEGPFAPVDHEHTALFGTATSTNQSFHSNTSFADLSGASTTVEVPAGHQAIIVARFSAQSACYGTGAWCSVLLFVNGSAMEPIDAQEPYVFDSSDSNTETSASWEGHAMERVSATLPSGTYTITVQVRTSTGSLTFSLDDWALVAEAKLTS